MENNNQTKKQASEKLQGNTYIRFKTLKGFFNTVIENIGSYEVNEESVDNTYFSCKIKDTISESDFYKCFLYLKAGLSKAAYKDDLADETLTSVNIDYLAAIMSKPLTFSMPVKSKNSVQANLAEELGKTAKSAYSAIHRLRTKGFLIRTEDNLIMPNNELQKLRVYTKKHLEELGCFPVSYLLNFIVVANDENYLENERKLKENKEDKV